MKVLIIGASGLLGRALVGCWGGDEVIAVNSKQVDIRDHGAVDQLLVRERPQWTVLAAAYTDVDGCERDPKLAEEVNATGAGHVARAAGEVGSRTVYLSTDYVFDGKKNSPYQVNDPMRPVNVYGRTKAQGEELVRKWDDRSLIVRTAWLYGIGKGFPEWLLHKVETTKELNIVNDQRGAPTYAPDLAAAIVRLVRVEARGIVHVTNTGECTWYDFAQAILKTAGIKKVKLTPVSSDQLVRPAKRPSYSVLSHVSMAKYNVSMRPWQGALHDYLKTREAMMPPKKKNGWFGR